MLAVAVLATSFYPIRHGAEIKPYASDLLAALILLALAVEWLRSPRSSRWWWALTAFVPVLLALSYPAVFVAGGIGLASGAPGAEVRPPSRSAGLDGLQPGAGRLVPGGLLRLHEHPGGGHGGILSHGLLGRVVPAPGSSLDLACLARWTSTRAR